MPRSGPAGAQPHDQQLHAQAPHPFPVAQREHCRIPAPPGAAAQRPARAAGDQGQHDRSPPLGRGGLRGTERPATGPGDRGRLAGRRRPRCLVRIGAAHPRRLDRRHRSGGIRGPLPRLGDGRLERRRVDAGCGSGALLPPEPALGPHRQRGGQALAGRGSAAGPGRRRGARLLL